VFTLHCHLLPPHRCHLLPPHPHFHSIEHLLFPHDPRPLDAFFHQEFTTHMRGHFSPLLPPLVGWDSAWTASCLFSLHWLAFYPF
jgi:hypothetical protein